MPEQGTADSNESQRADNPQIPPKTGRRYLIFAVLFLVVGITCLYLLVRDVSQRTQFLATSILSFLTLVVIAGQLFIYKKQWEAMGEQRDVMERQLESMEASTAQTQQMIENSQRLVEQNERAIRVSKIQSAAAQSAARSAEQSVEIAQENTIMANRAYLAIAGGTAMIAANNGEFNVRVQNFGKTPANGVKIYAEAEFRFEAPATEDLTSAIHTNAGVIPPGFFSGRLVKTNDITPDERELIRAGRLRLYTWGVIEYRDIFGKPRRTKFCFIKKDQSADMIPWITGNEAD